MLWIKVVSIGAQSSRFYENLALSSLFVFFFQTKYTLLDERDIGLVHDFIFEARTEIDRNGLGAVIFAYAYIYEKGRTQGQYVQDLLW